MTVAPETERDLAHHTAHRGFEGEIHVNVPDLDACLREICGGNADFLDALKGMSSAYSEADREILIDQLVLCLRSFYVHQPMKWAKHAVDPVRALSALRWTCKGMGDLEFHTAVARIFKSLRDIHTAYILPEPYCSSVWFLPFTMGVHWEDRAPTILVDRTIEGFPETSFRRGAEILTWNGQDIERAVRAVGREESGSNSDAQFAVGLRMMTIRWLGGSIAPNSHWATLGYLEPGVPGGQGAARTYREIRLSWRKLFLHRSQDGASGWEIPLQAELVLEKDFDKSEERTKARKSRHHKPICADRHGLVLHSIAEKLYPPGRTTSGLVPVAEATGETIVALDTEMPQIFTAERRVLLVNDQPTSFGYLRIAHFMASEDDFVPEFKRLLEKVPPDRLIIDLRSNAGGNPYCADQAIHLLADRTIEPLPFEFLATPEANAWLQGPSASNDPDFSRWGMLVNDSVANGFMFSPSRTLADPKKANSGRRVYKGAVALLVNVMTYSTGDIFAALLKDHLVGPIIGEALLTGGGGADMMDHDEIVERAPEHLGYRRLPHGARMHLAIRRFLRVGADAGMPVEEAGVKADYVHLPTANDFFGRDRDLMHAALRKLSSWQPGDVSGTSEPCSRNG